MKKQVTNKIRKLRLERGISQENVADELGITHSAYAKIERGETDPNLSRLLDIARVFNVQITTLFTDDSAELMVNEPKKGYDANKIDIDKLNTLILRVLSEIDTIKTELAEIKKPAKARKS